MLLQIIITFFFEEETFQWYDTLYYHNDQFVIKKF